MTSVCLVCKGYMSDGSDYYMRKNARSECSDCDSSKCACDDCDCSDWESGSENESENECSSADENYETGSSFSESEVEASDEDKEAKSDVKNEAKDMNSGFVKVYIQDSESSEEDTESENDTKKDGESKSNECDNVKEKHREKESGNSESSNSESDNDGYPKEITEFLMKNEKAESTDNTGVRTRRAANYYDRSRGHRHRRQSPGESGSGKRRGQRYRPHRGRSGNYRRKRFRRHIYSYTKMPSGSNYWITIPAAENSTWKCGNKTKLITLRPNGRMGRKEYQIITNEMEKTRKKHVSGAYSGYEIIKIEKIVNPCLWKRYRHRRRDVMREGPANEQLLFHGSPAYKEIIQTGFDERYSNISNMFGAGLYFAENSSKSNQYVWGLNGIKGCPGHKQKNCLICERQLLVCRVILGKVKELTTAQPLAHPPEGCHSVKGVPRASGSGLQYTENIVYRGEQVYPEFLVTYKLKI